MSKSDLSSLTARIGSFSIEYWRRSHTPGSLRIVRLILQYTAGATLVGSPLVVYFDPQLLTPVSARLSTSTGKPQPSTYCAPFGEHRSITLPDDTTLVLNTGTCATVAFSTWERRVQIDPSPQLDSAEAILQVTHDSNRPFVVDTGRVSILDAGTRFDVLTQEGGTRVAVFEGAVQIFPRGVSARQNGVPIAAGQQIDIPSTAAAISPIRRITPQNIKRMTAWVNGMIQFEHQPVGEVFAELERYQHFSLKTTDPGILNVRLGGGFSTTNINSLLTALNNLCIGSEYKEAEQTITLSRIVGKPSAGCP